MEKKEKPAKKEKASKTGPSFGKNLLHGMAWSTRNISFTVVNTLIVTYISFYATDVLGMKAAMISTVLLISKLLDGVSDLIAGFIVDNTHTKWGKARPYDWCTVMIGIFVVLLFSTPHFNMYLQAVWIFVMYVLVMAVFNTMIGASDPVYLLRAFPQEGERNSVFSISTVFAQFISITMNVFIPKMVANAGTDGGAWTKMVLMCMIPLTMIGMIRFFAIKEVVPDEYANETKEERKARRAANKAEKTSKGSVGFKDGMKAIFENQYILIFTLAIFIIVIASGFLNTASVYYFKYIVGDIEKQKYVAMGSYAMLAMLVGFLPLSKLIGKGRLMKIGLVIASVGNVIRWIGGANDLTLLIGMALLMMGIVPVAIYFPLYLFDIMDYSEWKTGKRVEGVLAVFPNFANKVASGLSVSLGGYVLAWAGYDGTAATQTEKALKAIDWCFNGIPTALMVVMTVIILVFYNIDKKMPQITKDLAERRGVTENVPDLEAEDSEAVKEEV